MYVKKIKYEDYDGNEREEDFMFNLNKAEIVKWITTSGGYTLDKLLEKITKEKNGKEVLKIFEDLIIMSYGVKSIDGRRFDKSKAVKEDFIQTEAYSELFTELISDPKAMAEFINGVMPKTLAEEVQKVLKENPEGIPDEVKDYVVLNENGKNKAAPPNITVLS